MEEGLEARNFPSLENLPGLALLRQADMVLLQQPYEVRDKAEV